MLIITPKFLNAESVYLDMANLLLGMIMMVTLNSLITGLRSRNTNYLYLAMFFTGTLINAVCNLYSRFILPTIEPYTGSWISILAFTQFSFHYLQIPSKKRFIRTRWVLSGFCLIFLGLSIMNIFNDPDTSKRIIFYMDIFSASIILVLLALLIMERIGGNKKAGSLLIFEGLMVAGAISAMGIFKEAVAGLNLIPLQFLQGNLMFLTGMTVNGLLFSYILSGEMIELRVQKALSEMKNCELKQLDRARTDFMMNISHELRTPVTIIGGVINQLKQGRWGGSLCAAKEQLDTIERNNLRLMKQITNLLELSRLEQHRMKLSLRRLELSERLGIIAAEFQSLAEQHRLKLTSKTAENIELTADPLLFDTAVLNLLSNAVKFTPPGGSINISAIKTDDKIRIAVADTGPGITSDNQEKIFLRFQQAEETTSSWRGTGIGLSLVRGIMDLHNGTAGVDSTPGEGSTFYLDFPAIAETAGDTSPAESSGILFSGYKAELETQPAPDNNTPEENAWLSVEKPQILIVEDNNDLVKYLDTELSPCFRVTTASNGKKALKQLENFLPDLIISDIMMPEMDGCQLHAYLRKSEKTAAVPFLFLTARDSAEEKITALKNGAVDYIKKPFAANELIAKAQAVIASSRAGRRNYGRQLKESLIDFIDGYQEQARPEDSASFERLCVHNDLTPREQDIAALIRKGLSDKEIASALDLSTKTVSNYNTSIFRKFRVSGRLELIAMDLRSRS